jgi:hypothetical protein
MKSGFDRIGHDVTIEHAKRSCLDKRKYDGRNEARNEAVKLAKRHGTPKMRPYRCTLCGGFHLTSKIPDGLRRGKPPTGNRRPSEPVKHSNRLPEEG